MLGYWGIGVLRLKHWGIRLQQNSRCSAYTLNFKNTHNLKKNHAPKNTNDPGQLCNNAAMITVMEQ